MIVATLALFSLAAPLSTAIGESPPQRTSLVHSGVTTLDATSGSVPVRIVVHSREVPNRGGECPMPRAYYRAGGIPVPLSPQSALEDLEIFVANKRIFVPPDAFWDMFDAREARIQIRPGKRLQLTLTIVGGNQGGAYTIKLECDDRQVRRKTRSGLVQPGKIAQDTRYIILDDGDVPAIEPEQPQ